jgi:DNA-binding transcriptional MerR regulator
MAENPQLAAEGLRPVDLARLAGVSTQQIRNYADSGILPAVRRTPAGYRRFDAGHRQALLTYRALTRGFGLPVARAVLQAVHAGDVPGGLALVDAAHAGVHAERVSLRAAGAALESVAAESPELPRSELRIGEVARLLGVRTSALRVWEAAGLLRPARERGTRYRTFGAADVRDARMVQMLRNSGYPLAQIESVLDGLRRTGSTDALRAAIARRHQALATRSAAMLEAAGPLHAYLSTLASEQPDDRRASSSDATAPR